MSSVYQLGEKVKLVILRETDLGYVAEINGDDEGLLYHNEVFRVLQINQQTDGFIKRVRPDGGIDLLLQSFGHLGAEELGEHILDALDHFAGFIAINAKSPAEDVYDMFGVSRKKFKMALGGLYKRQLIEFTDEGTRLIKEN